MKVKARMRISANSLGIVLCKKPGHVMESSVD